MLKCTKCGTDNQLNAKFCEACGTKLEDVSQGDQTSYQVQSVPTQQNSPLISNQYGQPQGQNFSQSGYPMQPQQATQGKTAQLGIQRNIAGILCYVFGWIGGLILFFIEKDDYVRFHAAQSVATFVAIHVLTILLGLRAFLFSPLSSLLSIVSSLISVGSFVLWILLMYKAYKGEYYKVPVIGDLVENFIRNKTK